MCLKLTRAFRSAVVDKAEAHKARIFGAITDHWLCVRQARLCSAQEVPPGGDDEDEEEDLCFTGLMGCMSTHPSRCQNSPASNIADQGLMSRPRFLTLAVTLVALACVRTAVAGSCEEVWFVEGNFVGETFTCGERIVFLQTPQGGLLTEQEARVQAALEELKCADCWPWEKYRQDGETERSSKRGIAIENSLLTADRMQCDPIDWLQQFFAHCEGCKVDAIGIHVFTCYAAGLKYHLDRYRIFGKPMWITEIACSDPASPERLSAEGQMAYMREAIPLLEADEDVAKYAWFSYFKDEWAHPIVPSLPLIELAEGVPFEGHKL
eukprot:g19521.t1